MPIYIDVHCHLDMCNDLDDIIVKSKENKIRILSNGVNIKSNRFHVNLKKENPNIKIALGLYPIDALELSDKEIDEEIQYIKKLNKNDQVVSAIGEVGLDFKFDKDNMERQINIFEKFILLSKELDIPIIVHSRKAEIECIELLEKNNVKKVIMHCFSGKKKLVQRIEKNGWFLSIPTNIVNSTQFQDNAKNVSLNNLFCETDAPYLHPFKEQNNKPYLVVEAYKKIAEIKGITIDELKNLIFLNWQRIFKD